MTDDQLQPLLCSTCRNHLIATFLGQEFLAYCENCKRAAPLELIGQSIQGTQYPKLQSMENWTHQQASIYSHDNATKRAMEKEVDRFTFVLKELKTLPPPREIYDMGCSDGTLTEKLRAIGYDVQGFDIFDVLMEQKLVNQQGYNALNLDLPFKLSNPPDIFVCLEILEHLVNDFQFLKSLMDSSKPNTMLLLSVPLEDKTVTQTEHLRFYPPPSLARLLRVAGWNDIKMSKGKDSLLVRARNNGA